MRIALSILALILAVLAPVHPAQAAPASWDPADAIRAALLEQYPWAEVTVADVRPAAALPQERPSAIVVEKAPPGRALFRFDFPRGQSVTASAQVKAFDRVLMTRAGFRKGYTLRRDDVYPALMDVGRVPKGALTDDQLVVGKPLLRSVVPNTPVTDLLVSDGSSVRRGRRVVLSVESPTFTIRTMGETKQDAAVGEQVKVLNLLSRKIVTGLLVDENTVRVGF